MYLIFFSNLHCSQCALSIWKPEHTFISDECIFVGSLVTTFLITPSHLDSLRRLTCPGLFSSVALRFSLIIFIFLNNFTRCHRAISQYSLLPQHLKSYQGPYVNHCLRWIFEVILSTIHILQFSLFSELSIVLTVRHFYWMESTYDWVPVTDLWLWQELEQFDLTHYSCLFT